MRFLAGYPLGLNLDSSLHRSMAVSILVCVAMCQLVSESMEIQLQIDCNVRIHAGAFYTATHYNISGTDRCNRANALRAEIVVE